MQCNCLINYFLLPDYPCKHYLELIYYIYQKKKKMKACKCH
jgi:hypothetical protein